jgi:hypothetical protein
MGAAGLVEQPGDEGFIGVEEGSADRADPRAFSAQAVGAAFDVHESVGFAHGGEGGGFHPFPVEQPDGAHRAGPGHPGFTLQIAGFVLFAPVEGMSAGTRQEAVSKVEKAYADNDKNQDLKIRIHILTTNRTSRTHEPV